MLHLLLPLLPMSVLAIDNGLGLTPPMGWRSWNLYHGSVNQSLLEAIMDGMVSKKRTVDGVPTSLCDLGYCDVGLDDTWQNCSTGGKYNYHDDSGIPVVNTTRFPDMIAMTSHAHRLGLTAGWYLNNCACMEKQPAVEALYRGDVAALTVFGFDALKLDGCGTQLDMDLWASLINGTGRRVMIENCHPNLPDRPNATWCPWNFYRTSPDVRASYRSAVENLLTTVQWADKGLSRPGCWAYPDMLEVGVPSMMTFAEMRTHFGAWAIVSSPLTLSHDPNDDKVMDRIWPIIANKEAIAVNQAWAGHSGSPFKEANETVPLADETDDVVTVPSWQFWLKPLGSGRVAVLLMNHAPAAQTLTLNFTDVPGLGCKRCKVRDIWERKDLGMFDMAFTSKDVASHDSLFLALESGEVEAVYT